MIFIFLSGFNNLRAQGLCNQASQISSNVVIPASLTQNNFSNLGYNLGCNAVYSNFPNNQRPTWLYCVISQPGTINCTFGNSANIDLDWAVWGPFAPGRSISDICINKMDNTAPVICDSGPGPGASGSINPTQVGQIYIILMANFTGTPSNCTLNFSGIGSIALVPTLTNTISPLTYCAGNSKSIPYVATNVTFNSGNIFTAQISDAAGSFASPVNIGSLSSTLLNGTISSILPSNLPAGNGYRVRVVSSNPIITGSNNGNNITINTSPLITCPGNISVNHTPGQCGAIVTYPAATASGTPAPTVSYSTASGSFFPIGTTPVTATATNTCGTTSCTFNVTINDNENPKITCNAPITVNNTPGTCGAAVSYTVTSTDNCPGQIVTQTAGLASGSIFPVGVTTNSFLVTDASGNTATCSFTVTVNDVEAPVSSTAANLNIYNGFHTYNGTTNKSALDAQIASQTLLGHQNIDCINSFYDPFVPASTGHGYYITVPFTEATAANFSFRLGADFGGGGAVFLDGNYLTGQARDIWWNNNWNSPDVLAAYNIPISAGNHLLEIYGWEPCCFGSMSIQLDLNSDGVWDCAGSLPTVTGECSATVTAPTALDNCAGLITGTTSDPTTYNSPGTYTVHWTFNDGNGNSSTSNQTVIINDVTPPVISCPGSITVNATSAAGAIVNYVAPIGTDNCSATTTRIAGPASGSTFPIGTTTVTHQVKDASNLTAQCSFTVTVTGIAPQIQCLGNIVAENTTGLCAAVVNFTAIETTAIPASTITYSHNPGSSFPVGTTTVTATATNAVGTSSCTFTITVRDVQPPTITCADPVTINTTPGLCTGTTTLIPPVITDNCSDGGNALSFAGGYVTVPDAPILNPFNDWTLETWVRLTTTGTQQSFVEKYNNPGNHYGYMIRVLSNDKIQAGVVFGCCGGYFVEGSTTLLANQWYHVATTVNRVTGTMKIYVNGILDAQLTGMAGLPVDPNTASLKLGARGDDADTRLTNGGLLDEVRVWSVERTQSEIATSMNVELGAQPGLVALFHLNQGIAGGNNTGLTTVMDASGNNNNGTLIGFALTGATSNWADGYFGSGSGAVTVTNNAPSEFPTGNTLVTWTATDGSGNSSTCTQTVTVTDNQAPVITVSDKFLCYEADNSGSVTNLGATAIDNCGIYSFVSDAPSSFEVGTTVVTWTATDIHGNTSTATQNVVRNPEIHISICASPTLTIYSGSVAGFGPLGPQSVKLSATVSGGTPDYSYSWTPVNGIDNPSIDNPNFSPTSTTTYTLTVTDSRGCKRSLSVTINVLPLSAAVCSGSGNNTKFNVCHIPPGQPNNPQQLCLSASAANAHLTTGTVGHGNCHLGSCSPEELCFNTAIAQRSLLSRKGTVEDNVTGSIQKDESFDVKAYPNPSASAFRISVSSGSDEPIQVRIADANGVIRNSSLHYSKEGSIMIGSNLKNGFYMAEVIQGKNRKVLKLIKVQ